MTLRVGVIGTGIIGQDHIGRLPQVLSGAEVVAVSDIDRAAALRAVDSGGREPVRTIGKPGLCGPRAALAA